MELIVYHDDNYPTSWISREQSGRMVNYLKSKGFLERNAEDLAKWMEKSIDEDTCFKSLVVFSQDVIPQTVCHSPSPSILIRTYLDYGGSVVWIGDVPFYYIGPHPKRRLKPLRDDALRDTFDVLKDRGGKLVEKRGRRGCFSVLGVVPVYIDFPSSKIRLSEEGKSFGLRSTWYSNRPIIIRGLSNFQKKVKILGTSKPLHVRSTKKSVGYAEEKEEKSIPLSSAMDLVSKIIGFISATVAALAAFASLILSGFTTPATLVIAALVFSLVYGIVHGIYWVLRSRETFASAWFKNFCTQHPSTGFLRIWDFSPDRITDQMLEELNNIALAMTERNKASKNSRESSHPL